MFKLLLVSMLFLAACAPAQTPSYVSLKGDKGDSGAPGDSITGPAGRDGRDGIDALPATIVQLCPGNSDHTVFVEIGLCLQGKLYGVYSANGGFLTYLADGAYSSNAIGSACNLVITGCVVSH